MRARSPANQQLHGAEKSAHWTTLLPLLGSAHDILPRYSSVAAQPADYKSVCVPVPPYRHSFNTAPQSRPVRLIVLVKHRSNARQTLAQAPLFRIELISIWPMPVRVRDRYVVLDLLGGNDAAKAENVLRQSTSNRHSLVFH